jgi:hypothetical protein
MIMLAICSMLIGSALAIRFRFIVLLPIIFLGSVVLVSIAAIQSEPFSRMALMVIVFATGLQLGYVFGSLMKHAMASGPGRDAIATAEAFQVLNLKP